MYASDVISPRGLRRAFTRVLLVISLGLLATVGVSFFSSSLPPSITSLTYHSSLVDQGASPTLSPGATTTYTLRYRNTGLAVWQRGGAAQVTLGVAGDSTDFAGMAVDWISPTRIATTNEQMVPPGMIGTFTFGVRAPATPGVYRIPLRLVVDGLTWLEDDHVVLALASDLGFHSKLVDQAAHPVLGPGDTSAPLTVHFRNTGARTWTRGVAGQQVNLGIVGDDKSMAGLAVGWPSVNRVAAQTESVVRPGGIGTFTFRVKAPLAPGIYPLRLRLVADGVTWLDDEDVVTLVSVGATADKIQVTPAPTFTLSAAADPGSLAAGGSVKVTAKFASSSATSVVVGVEVYSPGGATLAYQKWFHNESFAAGEERSYPVTWSVPSSSAIGTYTVNLSVFSQGWKALYGKKNGAASFAVANAPVFPSAPPPPAPTPVPTVSPTAAPTSGPTSAPTSAPTAAPSTAPTAAPTPTPAPAPSFTSTASAAPSSLAVGASVSLTAVVTSATSTIALVDVELVAPDGATVVHQVWFDNQTFAAGQQRSYSVTWQVPSGAATGTYGVNVGVFATGWASLYSWRESATSFSVTAPVATPAPTPTAAPTVAPTPTPAPTSVSATPSPTTAPTATPAPTPAPTAAPTSTPAPSAAWVSTAAVVPTTIATGGTASITIAVTSATTRTGLVDVEVVAPDNTSVVYQQWFDNQSFTAGQVKTYSLSWQVPSTAVGGGYIVNVGVFAVGWTSLYSWNEPAAGFTVTAPAATPTPAPTPTPVPTTTPAPTPVPPGGISGLHVQGNRIVNSSNTPIQLLGVNRSGPEYMCQGGYGFFDGPSDNASIVAIKSWRTNVVRVPLNEDCWLGINGSPAANSGANYQNAIKSYVSLLNQNGMYAILVLFRAAPGTQQSVSSDNGLPDRDHAPAFWSSVANTFKSNPGVIFEPYNEPFGVSWTCWRDGGNCGIGFTAAGMQEMVTAIRNTGANQLILLGGNTWSNDLTQWMAYKPNDPLNNLAAAWHIYNFNYCSNTTCYNNNIGPVVAQYPVVATEFGADNCDGTYLNNLMSWLDSKGQGYLGWTWDTWGTNCGSIALISDYSGTPTQYGQYVKNHLATR